MGIAYLDGRRLRRRRLAAAEWVDAGREELNRINVFPIPDGDPGTNLTLTLRGVTHALAPLHQIEETEIDQPRNISPTGTL